MKPNFENILDQVVNPEYQEKINALQKINLFSKINNEKTLLTIADLLEKKQYGPDYLLFSKGDQGDAMFFIEKGSLLIHDGDYVFSVLITGEVVGEYALIDDEIRSASVTTITDTILWELHRDAIDKYPDVKFEITKALVKVLSARLRFNNKLEANLAESHDQIRKKNDEINIQKEEIRAQAEHLEQVNKELEKLSIVAKETNNAITIMDASGNYLWVNFGFTKMYGYTFEELIKAKGVNLFNNPDNADLSFFRKEKNTFFEAISFEALNKTSWGENIWVKSTLTPVFNSVGSMTHLVCIDTNINDLKIAETEIRQQKEEIQAQNDKLYEINQELYKKNQQITDSINYAHRIQNAVLSSDLICSNYFSQHFILFKPKNIVSGDFYWMKKMNHHIQGITKIAVALADCTGHGVPGAFLSMLGITLMNEQAAYAEANLRSGDFLFNLRRQVISALQQNIKADIIPMVKMRDGMDMGLCFFEFDEANDSVCLQYSGANLSLFIIRENIPQLELNGRMVEYDMDLNNFFLFEIKPDKSTVGLFYKEEKLFRTNDIKLQKGDRIFFSSDGFYDQLSPEKMKFLKSTFKNELLGLQKFNMPLQSDMLNESLLAWQGCIDQTDDISVLGIKI